MKAISLTQPWAHLVMLGAKQWETRSWPTPYRGQIAIHASKSYPKWAQETEWQPFYREALGLSGPDGIPYWPYTHPSRSCGRIIAIAEITDCQPTVQFHRDCVVDAAGCIRVSDQELAFGDFHVGRFAFKLEKVLPIPQVECKGALGLWTVPDLIAIQILDDLKFLQRKEAINATHEPILKV